jgi:hypothetical protein
LAWVAAPCAPGLPEIAVPGHIGGRRTVDPDGGRGLGKAGLGKILVFEVSAIV